MASSQAWGNGAHGIETDGNAPKIGQLAGGPVSDRNHADANGFLNGASDGSGLGVYAHSYIPSLPPVGRNEASGNDEPGQCDPASLC